MLSDIKFHVFLRFQPKNYSYSIWYRHKWVIESSFIDSTDHSVLYSLLYTYLQFTLFFNFSLSDPYVKQLVNFNALSPTYTVTKGYHPFTDTTLIKISVPICYTSHYIIHNTKTLSHYVWFRCFFISFYIRLTSCKTRVST